MEEKSFIAPGLAAYIETVSRAEDPALAKVRRTTASHPEKQMQITPLQGQLLQMLIAVSGARKTLEIGVFTGYSSLAVALILPLDGRITALDISEEYTSEARKHWARNGVSGKIDLQVGPAAKSLDRLLEQGGSQTFDFAFIDADKPSYWVYFEKTLELLRPKGLVVIDNTLQHGRVADADDDQINTQAIRDFNARLAADARVLSVLLPVADGLSLAMKL